MDQNCQKKSVQQFPLSLFTWKGFSWTGRPGYLERCWDQRAYPWYSVLGYYWLFYCANWFLIVFLHFLCLIPPALVIILPKMAPPSVMRPNIRLDSPNVSVVQMSRKSHRRCWFPWCLSIQVAVMTMRMMMSWWWWSWRWWWPGSWYSVQRTWPDHIGLFRR